MKKTFASIAACSIVARHLIAEIVRQEAHDWWEAYPDICEEDWEEIIASVKRQSTFPDGFPYRDALNILKERGSGQAARKDG